MAVQSSTQDGREKIIKTELNPKIGFIFPLSGLIFLFELCFQGKALYELSVTVAPSPSTVCTSLSSYNSGPITVPEILAFKNSWLVMEKRDAALQSTTLVDIQ